MFLMKCCKYKQLQPSRLGLWNTSNASLQRGKPPAPQQTSFIAIAPNSPPGIVASDKVLFMG